MAVRADESVPLGYGLLGHAFHVGSRERWLIGKVRDLGILLAVALLRVGMTRSVVEFVFV